MKTHTVAAVSGQATSDSVPSQAPAAPVGPPQLGDPQLGLERRAAILASVEQEGRVLAAELARRFRTSEDTIRRDLRELDQAGRLRRVHGGAVRRAAIVEPFAERIDAHAGRKAALARALLTLVRPGDVVLLDSGSTNLHVAASWPEGLAATVVTPSPAIAAALLRPSGPRIVLLGGVVSAETGGVLGAQPVAELARIRADLAFLGACSASAEAGLGAVDPEDAALKRAFLDASGRAATALLSGKLGDGALFRIAPLDALDTIVVEADATDAALACLVREGADGPRILRAGQP